VKNEKLWFILESNKVQGPYQVQEVEGIIGSMQSPLIWGRGLSEWVPPPRWRDALKNPALTIQEDPDPRWRYRFEDQESGLMTYAEMVNQLRNLGDHSTVYLWNEQQPQWKEIFHFSNVIEELEITRRVHPRVPIMGDLHCELPEGKRTIKVISISEGGIGVSGAESLNLGQKFKAVMESANLFAKIPCTCEVVYVGDAGYAGLRFANLPMEARSALIEYITKFDELPKP
jgi:hypothetical protein